MLSGVPQGTWAVPCGKKVVPLPVKGSGPSEKGGLVPLHPLGKNVPVSPKSEQEPTGRWKQRPGKWPLLGQREPMPHTRNWRAELGSQPSGCERLAWKALFYPCSPPCHRSRRLLGSGGRQPRQGRLPSFQSQWGRSPCPGSPNQGLALSSFSFSSPAPSGPGTLQPHAGPGLRTLPAFVSPRNFPCS